MRALHKLLVNPTILGVLLGALIMYTIERIVDLTGEQSVVKTASLNNQIRSFSNADRSDAEKERFVWNEHAHAAESDDEIIEVEGLYRQKIINRQDDDSTDADLLYNKVRVLCFLLTTPDNLDKKAIHVYKSWANRCNKLIFVSSVANDSFVAPVIAVDVEESRQHLTAKTMHAFKHVWDNYNQHADWFMKADDDTFAIMENLRYFLADKDPNEAVFYGHHFQTIVKPQGYFSGGGGYVLSRAALKRYAEVGFHNNDLCEEDGGAEDVQFGKCMQKLDVRAAESYDERGAARFNCLSPISHLSGRYPHWYKKYDSHGSKSGIDALSDYVISFHYVKPQEMYYLSYYTYHLKVYGIKYKNSLHIHSYYYNQTSDKT